MDEEFRKKNRRLLIAIIVLLSSLTVLDHPLETIDLSKDLTMQAPATTIEEVHPEGPNIVRFGMFTFLASEAMLFAGLICGYMVLRGGAGAGWQMPEALKNADDDKDDRRNALPYLQQFHPALC